MVIELLADYERDKEDNNDDSLFYQYPKLVYHLDQSFRSRLSKLYRKEIRREMVILDLMSSWDSHLPKDVNYEQVIGHGLNQIELQKNKKLNRFWIQDLNKDQSLPLDDNSIDVCLMVAAWQYLQYPEAIASEINRIVKSPGKLIVSFSNRAFWTKATRKWIQSSDFQRLNYIRDVLESNGWSNIERVTEVFPSNPMLNILGIQKDPFFAIIANK